LEAAILSHPLADHLALELGKGEQHIQREPAHAGGGVERLGDRHERHPLLIEQLDQLGEVRAKTNFGLTEFAPGVRQL
jgi:hypothetical protein